MTLTERLIAPGATRGEAVLSFGTAFAGCALSVALGSAAGLPPLAVVVIAVVAFDLYGGAVVNATHAAKLWFHRQGRTARHHLGFVAIHVQPFVLAWAVPGFTWTAAAVIYASALAAALVVTAVPLPLRRPAAFAATALALVWTTAMVAVPGALAWFAPVLLIKLLLAHLLPEEAAR
ncbi:hypothetical protein AB0B45_10215 [Nonomuraea sp. NPDC049152]|uniref:hypothetical protein n=1 Tax=Nonomuraea sp. NPDC049152 TaxID=3154350 RepID=UPI0033C7D881